MGIKENSNEKSSFAWRPIVINGSLAILLIGSIGGAIGLIWYAATQGKNFPPEIAIVKDIFLFAISLVATLIISHWYAKMSNTEKVDTIAERSTEKMVLLSLQIEDLNLYLKDTIEIARKESDVNGVQGAVQAFTHRIAGASNVLEMMARSNDAFRSDWLGVVSGQMKKQIEKKYDALRVVFAERASAIGHVNSEYRAAPSGADPDKLDAALRQLPASARLSRIVEAPYVPVTPAIKVLQEVTAGATEIRQTGTLKLEVLRDIFKVVGTGKLAPRMHAKPWITVNMVSCPNGIEAHEFKHVVGVGTNFDFNLLLKSEVYGKFLPIGIYEFTYSAEIRPEGSHPSNPPGG